MKLKLVSGIYVSAQPSVGDIVYDDKDLLVFVVKIYKHPGENSWELTVLDGFKIDIIHVYRRTDL